MDTEELQPGTHTEYALLIKDTGKIRTLLPGSGERYLAQSIVSGPKVALQMRTIVVGEWGPVES